MATTRSLAPPTVHLDEPTPNIKITVIDGTVHHFAFHFAEFLELKFALDLNQNLTYVRLERNTLS